MNIALNYGEVNLVSGHSGEGKSTLLYIISGIIPNITDGKLAGEVLINGENIPEIRPEVLAVLEKLLPFASPAK